ncbi:MAG: bifunctional tRNA (5-methylaminomethyl-2-thiouridine)(34)-methyltransferase MnmD/FAD-dependent 5-carboxymethylaminomethyl-2-thiouridine(34) oxidoreductase MnmC [Thiobacillus sp.]|nr:bifunctional tRNA (5-methylaminomethyl-2-thiouridine)(34)-methyltransferase MnmD/FAD-dependent 5-carboxymethylaminomethyl-2-thiouridine(34) oxidoreductase MnmC [Thiobacillus sp.]
MLKTIVPATLEFKDGMAYSTAYGDIYHSADGGAGQARYVFLQGCGLPQAWGRRASFVVLETGFGTGLNFLATWAAWRDDPARPARLHFLSIEKHPFRAADLAALHAQWPEFAKLSDELIAKWPLLVPGFHRIALDGGRVQLTLMLGDVRDCLPQVLAGVDAFYLDGFNPDSNAEMWQPKLFYTLARLARPGARAATYTVAAAVRQGLERAGFVCEKRMGYGSKRYSLAARYSGSAHHLEGAAPRHVAVIGAGVAGAAVAHALAQRGIAVTVLERADAPAQAASGNPVGVFRPVISRDDNRSTRLTRAAFLHVLRAWPALGGPVAWSGCGVLHLARDAEVAVKQQQALADTAAPAEYARWVEQDEARELANWPVDAPGVFYPTAGWVEPGSLCRAWLDHSAITLRTSCAVARVQACAGGWQLLADDGGILLEADAVVLANAFDALNLVTNANWPLELVRGQITRLPPGSLPEIQRVIAREGYIAPGVKQPVIGATYENNDDDITPRRASDLLNLERLEAILPGANARVALHGRYAEALSGRASLRATMPDRLPIVGAVAGHAGLYVAAGYASRGMVWAGLLGEALADQITAQPCPLEADLMRAIAPDRYS